ncbi:Aste57867_19853 [Aphanomyces stellatus]|uniref:Aste57867_19853 protein n=1 Tax=Aphanomyces stellatus TaxID=120398 RepID=A0A485LDQ7_9STRA|nr:hypothetical protein As57867_019787 [Aphanomyces stellatus]VFT96551.1 Aste57867_19853 [Aphanomyces stellatus]
MSSPSCDVPLSGNLLPEKTTMNQGEPEAPGSDCDEPPSALSSMPPSTPDLEGDDDDATTSSDAVLEERMGWFNAEPDLEECCTANGLTRKQFARRGDRVTSIEMFLGFWPSMQSVRYFSLLTSLSIVKHPTIASIQGLDACPLLESVRIIECSLTHIENLDACTKLTHLNLSSNRISKIERLASLTSLTVLWLNDNLISTVAGLGACVRLTHLWLAKNNIEKLETGLESNKALVEVNVAANKLHSFQTLAGLTKLPALRTLSLSDPHFGDNPVCRLCNYQTYLLCQLPGLTFLDTIELSATNKQVADTTLIKKRMYYNMRIKTIKRNVTNCLRKARTVYNDHLNYANFNLNALMRELSDLDKELHAETTSPFPLYPPGALATKRDRIQTHIRDKMRNVHAMIAAFEALNARLALASDKTIRRLVLELNTGGNIRLEDGKPSDVWYSSCVDLLTSRAFVGDLAVFGVQALHVRRVTRINNRYLRNRFQERMDDLLDGPDDHVKENVSKRGVTVKDKESSGGLADKPKDGSSNVVLENALEYLFYMQPPRLDHLDGAREQDVAVEAGLRTVDDYAGVADAGIKLANSLAALDLPRLATALHVLGQDRAVNLDELAKLDQFGWATPPDLTLPMRSAQRRAALADTFGGVVLIAKVFLGHTRHVDRVPEPSDVVDGLQCLTYTKPTDAKQKCFYVRDATLVLPEYLVEYEYVRMDTASQVLGLATSSSEAVLMRRQTPTTTTTSTDDDDRRPKHRGGGNVQPSEEALQDMGDAFAWTEAFQDKYKLTFAEPLLEQHLLEETTKGLIQLEPTIVRRQVMGLSHAISPVFVLESARQTDFGRICDLNLTSCGLKSLAGLELCPLVHLETLVLSFNEIRKIECLDALVALKSLDLGYNILRSLDNVGGLGQLRTLLVNNNLLYRFEDVRGLGHLNLQVLDLRNNAICEAKRYRLHVIQRLPQLTTLDMAAIVRTELQTAMSLCAQLTPLKIWTCSRWKERLARHDTALDVYQRLHRKTRLNDEHDDATTGSGVFDEDGPWWQDVDELHVNHELLTKLSHLDRLQQLRIASFSDNDITYIDGLTKCTKLEELVLDNNQIMTIENLDTLMHLKVLDLGKNKLTCMKNLDALVNLKQLSLEDNDITSLQGLSHLVRLMELYIGNNNISNLKEIQHLKSLPKLIIVDFSGNGFCADDEYQLYTIYNLRRVKVLDGASVTAELQNEAKQAYSGKLTTDFLIEKIGHAFNRIQEMELSSCRIREIGSLHGDVFINLKDLNLENNLISDISGLEKLTKLRVLNLSNNKLEQLANVGPGTGVLACPKLENLQLARNAIADMTLLGLQHLPDLKVLNLESNDITSIAGLAGSRELKELYLSKNKIRQFDPPPGQALGNLVLLKIDDNSLRSLVNFYSCHRLQALDISNNRLADMEELERLHGLMPILQELWVQNNPVSKRHLARSTIVFRYPSLKSLDGKDITLEERERVEVLFMHDRTLLNPTLPPNVQLSSMGSSSKTSVKLTAMSFDSLSGSQRRKASVQQSINNNGVTLLPQVPQSTQATQQQPMSTRDEKDKFKDDKDERRKTSSSVLPDTLLNNNPMGTGLNNSLSTSFASFSQTKGLSRPGEPAVYSNVTAPQKTTYLAQPTGHVFTSRNIGRNSVLK